MKLVTAGLRDERERMARRVLWAGALLGLALAVLRLIVLRPELAEVGVFRALGVILVGLRQDWLLVLALTLGTLSLLRAASRPGVRRALFLTFAGLVSVVLLWGLVNLVALRMLGAPVTMDWVAYSDIAHTDVIFDSLVHLVSPFAALVAAALLASLWLGAWGLGRARTGGAPALLGLYGMGAVVAMALLSMPSGVAPGRLANPVVAFVLSIGRDEGAQRLAEMAQGSGAAQMPFAPIAGLARPEAPARPLRNVVFFAYESTPAKQAQGWGGTQPVTPYLEARLGTALAFDRAYAHVPASNYFLVSAFAGIIPELSSVSMTATDASDHLATLPRVLRGAGLRTAFFNSSDNRFQNTEAFVTGAGFETVKDYRDWTCDSGVYAQESVTEQFLNTSSDLCTAEQIIGWIEADPGAPFFVAFRTGMTHHPYFPGEDPQIYSDDETYNRYLNALRVGDESFGRLMAYLDETGLAEETLVVVLGDHGEAFGEHGTYVHAAGINEENVHIPLALINPQLFAGSRTELPVGIADLAPTIADLLGLRAPAGWEGRSVFAAERRDGVFFFAPWNGFLVGYREADRKVIYNGNTGVLQLFDLAADPQERADLAAEDPAAAAQVRATLSDAMAAHTAFTDALLSGQAPPAARPPADEVVITASGTRYLSAPKGWVMLDGAHVGGFEVTAAPSNEARAATRDEINAAMTEFRLPVTAGPCPRQLELYFLNDEWAGNGQTGDTDLVVRSVVFDGKIYLYNRFTRMTPEVGGVDAEDFRFWRKGGVRIDLDLDRRCVSAELAVE